MLHHLNLHPSPKDSILIHTFKLTLFRRFKVHITLINYTFNIQLFFHNSFFIYLLSNIYILDKIIYYISYLLIYHYIIFQYIRLLWFEHNLSLTQIRRLTNPALTCKYTYLYSENIRFERMRFIKPNKFQAYHFKPLSQFSIWIIY